MNMIDYSAFYEKLTESRILEQYSELSPRHKVVRLITDKGKVEVELKDEKVVDILAIDDEMRWPVLNIVGLEEYIMSYAVQKAVFKRMLRRLKEKNELEYLFKSYLDKHEEPEALSLTYSWMGIRPSVEMINDSILISVSEEGPYYAQRKISGAKSEIRKDEYRKIYLEELLRYVEASLQSATI